jgi:hypothetical protein
MSAERSGKSHAGAWAFSILTVPVLYMLSVPPLVIMSDPFSVHTNTTIVTHLGWVSTYAIPFSWIKNSGWRTFGHPPLEKPLDALYNWWDDVLP